MGNSLWSATTRRLSRRASIVMAAVAVVALVGAVAGGLFYTRQAAHAYGDQCQVGSNTGTPSCTFKGLSAAAFFDSISADGCTDTSVDVLASRGFDLYPSYAFDHGSSVYLSIFQYDTCAQQEVMFAGGFASNANFIIDNQLNTATLNTTVNVTNWNSATQSTFPVTVNLTWQGYGATTHIVTDQHQTSKYWESNFHFNGDTRSATASGVVSPDGTTNYTNGPASPAYLSNVVGGYVYNYHAIH